VKSASQGKPPLVTAHTIPMLLTTGKKYKVSGDIKFKNNPNKDTNWKCLLLKCKATINLNMQDIILNNKPQFANTSKLSIIVGNIPININHTIHHWLLLSSNLS
jgi:hypothetical protein